MRPLPHAARRPAQLRDLRERVSRWPELPQRHLHRLTAHPARGALPSLHEAEAMAPSTSSTTETRNGMDASKFAAAERQLNARAEPLLGPTLHLIDRADKLNDREDELIDCEDELIDREVRARRHVVRTCAHAVPTRSINSRLIDRESTLKGRVIELPSHVLRSSSREERSREHVEPTWRGETSSRPFISHSRPLISRACAYVSHSCTFISRSCTIPHRSLPLLTLSWGRLLHPTAHTEVRWPPKRRALLGSRPRPGTCSRR